MNRTSIVIQARLGSTRLKNKVLKKIYGKTIIEIMMDRLSLSKYSENIIIAIPNNKQNKQLYFFLKKKGFNVQVGDEHNVLKRFYRIAKNNNLKNIIRLSSDCPFIDHKIIELMSKKFFKKKLDYISTSKKFADGLDCEMINYKSLEKIYKRAKYRSEKEHVTLYLKNNKNGFKTDELTTSKDNSNIRITLDEKKDLHVLKKIIEKFPEILEKKYISSSKIINFLKKNKKISNINSTIVRNQGLFKSYKNEGINILFISQLMKKTGTGNTIRLINYSNLINEKQFKKYFIINSDSKQLITNLKINNYKKIHITKKLKLNVFKKIIIGFIQKYNIKIIFADLITSENLYKNETDQLFQSIKESCNVKIISIEDYRKKSLNSDLAIIPQFVKKKQTEFENKNLLEGLKYYPFPSEMRKLRQSQKNLKKIKNILVFISGSDPMDVTTKVANILKHEIFRNLNIKIFLSKKLNILKYKEIENKIKNFKNINLNDFSKKNFLDTLKWSHVNIIGEGSILVESIFIKKVVLVIKSLNNNYSNIKFLNFLKSKKIIDLIKLPYLNHKTIFNKFKNFENLLTKNHFKKNNHYIFNKNYSFNLNNLMVQTLKHET